MKIVYTNLLFQFPKREETTSYCEQPLHPTRARKQEPASAVAMEFSVAKPILFFLALTVCPIYVFFLLLPDK